MKHAIITLGLPNSGKTTWADENINPKAYNKISADSYKESHASYDPNNSEELHEWSVKKAEEVLTRLAKAGENIFLDSGSINNRYTIRLINVLKENDFTIKLVHIKTPYQVCLERNRLRERKVPEKAITDKALKETSQFHKLKTLVDQLEIVDYFTNKYWFIDMDGVLAAQSTLPIINGEIDFANGEIHKWQEPVMPLIHKINKVVKDQSKLYILSATANSIAYDEKQEWLNRYFNIPKENRFFVNQGRHKAEMLDNLARKFKYDKKDILLIDDMHDILYKVKERGMNAMHPSEFLTHSFVSDV